MNSTPNPKSTKDVLVARTDEQLARIREQIASADEEIARVTEQLSKMVRDDARNPSAGPGPQLPRGRSAVRGLIGLLLAACIVVGALVLQSSRDGVMLIVARWAPQLVSTLSSAPINPPLSAQPGPSFKVTTSEAAPPQAAPLAQTGPQDAAPTPAGASELIQLLQTMARDVANLERGLEQLKAKQDQIAFDHSKAIEQIKAKQEDMARLLAKVSEQSAGPTTTSLPPAGPTSSASKPAPTQSPQARARPPAPPRRQYPPPWRYYYEEW
jgi:hypothetical protein